MTIRPKHQRGFTLIEIMISVTLVGLLATIAIPNFIKSRTTVQTNVCINNLRVIDEAVQQWALEQKKGANAPVQFSDISDYLKHSVTCPAGGASFADSYSISTVGTEPSCQRVPGSHLFDQLFANVVSVPSDPSGIGDPGNASPPSSGSTSSVPPANGNNGNNGNGNGKGNNGNGNGHGNGNGNGNGNNGNGNGNHP